MRFLCSNEAQKSCHIWQNVLFVKLLRKENNQIFWNNHLLDEINDFLLKLKNPQITLLASDLLFLPRYNQRPGRDETLEKLVSLLAVLLKKPLKILWKIRGGITPTQFPHTLSLLLKDYTSTIHGSKKYPAKLQVQIALSTLDAHTLRRIEGAKVSLPDERIRLMHAFQSRQIQVVLLLDPLLPLVNDQQSNLKALFETMDDIGISIIRSSYFILTRHRERILAKRKSRMTADMILAFFIGEAWRKALPHSRSHALQERHKLLPQHLRRAGQKRLLQLGEKYQIHVEIKDPVTNAEVTWQANKAQRKEQLLKTFRKSRRKSKKYKSLRQLRIEQQLNLF